MLPNFQKIKDPLFAIALQFNPHCIAASSSSSSHKQKFTSIKIEEKVISDGLTQNALKIINFGIFVSTVIKNILHYTALQRPLPHFFTHVAPPFSLVSSVIVAMSKLFSPRQHTEICGGQNRASELSTYGKILAKNSRDKTIISVSYKPCKHV